MQCNLGTISDLIQYFNLNKQIFEKQRNNKQHMQRIMAMLTQQNMKILQKQFQLYTKGLELPTFIYLMKKLYVPETQLSKYYFVSDLIKFFQAIDVNGDGHLEWSEFTEYIIENIRRVQKPNYKNKLFEENEIISSAYSKISNEYKITKVIDTGANNPIKKIVYLMKQKRYFVLQAAANGIKIFDEKWAKIDQFALKSQNQTSYIIDFAFDQENQIFCAIFDGSARFCSIKLAGAIKFINQVQEKKLKSYHKVQYLHRHGLWSFLSKTGELKYSKVNYKSRSQLTYTNQLTMKQHDTLITQIVQIQEPKYILTSSMDGTIKLFSIMLNKSLVFQHISEETHSIINGKNKKGILGVDYTREFGSFVLAYGFSTKIYIYNLDISLTRGYTGKYSQHSGNLISVKFLKSYPYVLSFDDKLNLRIWDFRTFQTIQIINCQKNFINPSKIQIIPELSQCLICERKVTQFRAPSLQKKSKQINQFYSIFDFKICSMTNNIFVFTSNDVRVYNYITGALMNVFTKLDQNSFETNITAAEFGYKSRKFFLGDAAGYVRQFDSQTGDFLQDIRPEKDVQNKGIVKIVFLKQHSLLVVCSLDGRIMIYERNSQSQFQIIRDIRDSHEQLTCAATSVRYCLLGTGSQNGTVNIWNIQKFTLQAVLVLRNKIVSIAFSPIHPIMIVVEQSGVMNFFYVRPYQNVQNRYKCFLRVQNRDQQGTLQQISSFSFDLVIKAYFNKKCSLIQGTSDSKHHFIVTIGQKNGQVVEANLNSIIGRFKIQQNHQIFSTKKSIRCQVQNAKTLISNQRNKILSIQGYSNTTGQVMVLSCFANTLRFTAHAETVDQILFIKQNSIILTTSSDKKLKVFSLEGELNGSIDFFTFKKIQWKVSEINFHKKLQAIQTCIYAIKLIQNRKFSGKQQQEIKINLLMNQFMDEKEKCDYLMWIKVARRNRKANIRSRPVTRQRQSKLRRQSLGPKTPLPTTPHQFNHETSSDQDEQMLQLYFRNLRLADNDYNSETGITGQQSRVQNVTATCQSMSDGQFNQIYKKLQAKIKKKLNQEETVNHRFFSSMDINQFIVQSNNQMGLKKASHELEMRQVRKPANSSALTRVMSEQLFIKPKVDLATNLSNLLVVPIQQNRLISPKQNKQYERLFYKDVQNSQKSKTNKKANKKQVNNMLYQNLTEARRKINIISKAFGYKGTMFG